MPASDVLQKILVSAADGTLNIGAQSALAELTLKICAQGAPPKLTQQRQPKFLGAYPKFALQSERNNTPSHFMFTAAKTVL